MRFLLKDKTDEELTGYFKEYVESFQCKERHSQAACDEELAYDKLVAYFFPKELKPQVKLFNKMMDVAVEYEESGFMAGYRMCLKHLQEQAESFEVCPTNPPSGEEQGQEKADTGSVDAKDFISSKQIAEMFGTPNWKVVRRIDEYILPKASAEEKTGFIKRSEKNRQNKETTLYYLGYDACKKYIDYMMDSKKFHNVEVGIAKLIVEMRNKFQTAMA